MTITLTNGGTTVELPADLEWTDEMEWSPLVQRVDYSLTGALLIQQASRVQGRPITLTGGETFGWVSRSVVEQLKALEATPGAVLTLLIHGASREVRFRLHEPPAVVATPVVKFNDPTPEDFYIPTLKLMEV